MSLLISLLILATGVPAHFINQYDGPVRRWAPVLGLVSQVFWIWHAIDTEAWGILGLVAVYGYGWWIGFRRQWLVTKRDDLVPDCDRKSQSLGSKS